MTAVERVFVKTEMFNHSKETIAASITGGQLTVKELTEQLLLKMNLEEEKQAVEYELRLASSDALLPETSLVQELVQKDELLVMSMCKTAKKKMFAGIYHCSFLLLNLAIVGPKKHSIDRVNIKSMYDMYP